MFKFFGQHGGRIIFIEPNDASGTIDNTTITPDYTDYSVMFSLSCEIINRMECVGVTGTSDVGRETVSMTWMSGNVKGNNREPSKVYFTRGPKISDDERTYLTTYYSDIDYRSIVSGNAVEGIGVESVEIALENFYAASVKIRFVDMRGTSVFSLEEQAHKDTTLTAENIYSCFFTMPYPRFTLLVKGYYGKAMTYQLTCVGFTWKFDADTGNFIADASFIGYDFGILSDLPLKYIVSAPCDNNIGSKYWEKHKTDREWQLVGEDGQDEEPIKLIDLYQKIKNAVAENKNIDFSKYRSAVKFNTRRDRYDKLVEIRDVITNSIKTSYTQLSSRTDNRITARSFDDVGDNGMYRVSSSVEVKITESPNMIVSSDEGGEISQFSDLYVSRYVSENQVCPTKPDFSRGETLIEEYNKMYPDKMIDGFNSDKGFLLNTDLTNQNKSSLANETTSNGAVVSVVSSKANIFYDLDLTAFFGRIRELISEINEEDSKSDIDEENTSCKISELIGFTPYIGNVVKLLMCHLETFVHTVYCTAEEVYSNMAKGARSPKVLGVTNLQNTLDTAKKIKVHHIDNDSQIPPFPGVIIKETEEDDGYMYDRNGWPGDIRKNGEGWAEYRLVTGYIEAAQRKGSESFENVTIKPDDKGDNDIFTASYIYFKNLWDRWLVSASTEEFKVKNMMSRFAFVDGYYRDISDVLHINADVVMDCVENTDVSSTVYNFLKTISSKHNCKLFAYGDTISFSPINGNTYDKAIQDIRTIFTPFPYSAAGKESPYNMMVFMYENKHSETLPGGINGFSDDNMYISDGNKLTKFAENAFASQSDGYFVPSFGVTFGRQDNSIFKNVKVGMEVPTMTGESAKSMQYIAERYGGKRRKVNFYGQDLYRILTKYSYICEFDMMGDVQVTPLMYFQLFNMPLFRGTYMIYSVVHKMVSGDMTTHVKGMRMSVDSMPFPEEWFSDDVREIFTRSGISLEGVQEYSSAEEIDLSVNPNPPYSSMDLGKVVDIVMSSFNRFLFYNNGETFVSSAENDTDEKKYVYCGIYRPKHSDWDEGTNGNGFGWNYIDNKIDALIEENPEITENEIKEQIDADNDLFNSAREYYISKAQELNIYLVKDPLVAAQLLTEYMMRYDIKQVVVDSLKNTYDSSEYIMTSPNILSGKVLDGINGTGLESYRDRLCKRIKFERYTYSKGTPYTNGWMGKVDTITSKVNEKFKK